MTHIEWPQELDWHLGVTGSRARRDNGIDYPTRAQLAELSHLLRVAEFMGAKYLHQGCCTGWDDAAVRICATERLDLLIYAHPPEDDRYLSRYAVSNSHVIYKPHPYKVRDEAIAKASHLIIAGPAWPEDHLKSRRSGTWLTVRLGRTFGDRLYAVDQHGKTTDVTEPPKVTETNGDSV